MKQESITHAYQREEAGWVKGARGGGAAQCQSAARLDAEQTWATLPWSCSALARLFLTSSTRLARLVQYLVALLEQPVSSCDTNGELYTVVRKLVVLRPTGVECARARVSVFVCFPCDLHSSQYCCCSGRHGMVRNSFNSMYNVS